MEWGGEGGREGGREGEREREREGARESRVRGRGRACPSLSQKRLLDPHLGLPDGRLPASHPREREEREKERERELEANDLRCDPPERAGGRSRAAASANLSRPGPTAAARMHRYSRHDPARPKSTRPDLSRPGPT